MSGEGKRRYTRITFESKVDLRFSEREYLQCETKNLCLSGVWVLDGRDQRVGDQCDIIFHNTGVTNNRMLRIKGEIVRVDDGGIALIFNDMNLNILTNLQTIMLNQADDPFALAEEFLDTLPVDQ